MSLKIAVCAIINSVNQKASASAMFNYFENEETDVARLIMVALTKHWKRSHCGVGWRLVLWGCSVFYSAIIGRSASLRKMIVLQFLHIFHMSELSVPSSKLRITYVQGTRFHNLFVSLY
jgi:hypothetical protein